MTQPLTGFRTKYDLALQEKWCPSCLHPRRIQYREGFNDQPVDKRLFENYHQPSIAHVHPGPFGDLYGGYCSGGGDCSTKKACESPCIWVGYTTTQQEPLAGPAFGGAHSTNSDESHVHQFTYGATGGITESSPPSPTTNPPPKHSHLWSYDGGVHSTGSSVDAPMDLCIANVNCAKVIQKHPIEKCCPNPNPEVGYMDCCDASCAAHPRCVSGGVNTGTCCPNESSGKYDECCDNKPVSNPNTVPDGR